MGSKERKERERDAVRTKILDAARELFAAHGYEGVSMRAIADAIEYSPTAIYQHFEDKEALVLELCHADFGQLADYFQSTLAAADSLERLRQCGLAYARFAIAYPNHYRLMFITPRPVKGDEQTRKERQGNPKTDAYAFLRALVEMLSAEGRLRDPKADIDLVAQTLWAGLHGAIALELSLQGDEWLHWQSFDDRIVTMIDTLSRGLFVEKG